MVGDGTERPEAVQQDAAGRAVVAVDDENLRGGSPVEVRDVDDPQFVECRRPEDAAGVRDATTRRHHVVRDRRTEHLQFAHVGTALLHRGPRHDPVGAHRSALQEGERGPAESPVPSRSKRSTLQPCAANRSASARSARWVVQYSYPSGGTTTTPVTPGPDAGWVSHPRSGRSLGPNQTAR